MHHPQVIVYERDSRLAELLKPLASANRWALRVPRQTEPLWRFLRQDGPTVLVVKLTREAERELALIERVGWELPDVGTIAVGDPEEDATLESLAWDVGVSFALFPPVSRELLPEVVAGLMKRAVRRSLPAAEAPP